MSEQNDLGNAAQVSGQQVIENAHERPQRLIDQEVHKSAESLARTILSENGNTKVLNAIAEDLKKIVRTDDVSSSELQPPLLTRRETVPSSKAPTR